ncbi:hypothetical protein TRFO_20596 [Tritrichomonas foetus]|uniref:Protein kinase domain-containing protein n=1 Tax=Tritrichomonas foetus TaxID=1144522 RepID=A0A1J4KFK7_9EUKA|nr:hypothetical protein TRFO_20596 [Tritrichomonas foetus]|eukprot:OHT10207.1 hypothetical protein TRFO_20596 [Tritrichomonas foetus]
MPDKAEHNEYDINLKDCDININLSVDIFYDITFFWNFKIPCIITNNMNLISSKIFKPLTVFHFVDDFLCICSENICCVIHIEQFDFSFFENRKETVFLPLDKNDIYFIRKYVNKINIVSEYEIEIVAEDVTQILNYFKELSHTNEDLKSGNISKNQSNTQNEENQSNNETIQVNHFEKSSDNTENKLASENYINASENPSNNFFLHFDEISQKNFSIQHNIKLATFIKLIIHIVASFFIYRHSFPRSSFYKKSFFHSTKFKNTFQEFYRHNFIYLHVLGNGANSFNCLVVHKETGDFFSLKSFYNKKSYLREKKIYQMVNHKCVLKCYGFIKPTIHSANKNFAIVLDNCAHGNLRKFIKTHSLNNTEKTKILLQVLFGLDHLHSKGIIHRDIKIDNILLNENYDAILSDFDISRSYDNNRAFTTNVGTFRYMAPEQIIHQNISFQTDLYSFGLMIYQIATNKEPYEKLTLLQMVDKISQGNVPKISQTIYGKIIEIYRMCTSLNIEKRVGSFYILRQMISHELYFLNTDSNFIHKKVIEKLEDYKDKYIISSEKLSLNNSNSFEFNSNKQEFNPRINTENELANNAVFDGTTSSINQNDKSQINKDSIKLKNLKKTTSKENNNDESPSDVRKDVQFIIDMAENGHTTSQFYLGLIYLQGTELQQDQQKAFKLLKMAADKGHAIAAYNIAISYEKSNNLNEAIKYYKMAANGKFPNAFYALSRLSQDPEEVIFYLKQACELNFTKALYSLGVHYSRTEKDYVKAFEYFHKAADLGDADAMEKVGEYLGHGKGTEMNQKKSFEMFKIAAEQGNVDAMYNLGVCYKEGRGCLVNKNKSSECFEKAAKRGHVKSIYNYGLLCGDKTRAFECFKKAALKDIQQHNIK